MKILIPYHYYSTNINIALTGETTGYEIRKALSPDLREYSKVSASANTDFNYSSVTNSYKSGLLLVSDTFNVLTDSFNIYKSLSADYSSATGLSYENYYGSTGTDKFLKIFPAESTTDYKYFRIDITGTTSAHNVNHICHGYVFELPETFRNVDQSFDYRYPLSEVSVNLKGKIYFDGWQTNGLKQDHTLQFEWLNSTEKNKLIDMFQLGKGGLPVWFIEDETDVNTWKLVAMKTLTISEPYTQYFKVEITLREI